MGYLIKAPVGLAMFFGGIVLFNVKLVSLLPRDRDRRHGLRESGALTGAEFEQEKAKILAEN